MDLRDEVAGTEGTIRLDHFLRTGFEMFTAAGEGGYVAEKAESRTGWLFPVGDEAHELGYVHMFQDMLDAHEAGRPPRETFYDGYVVNAIIDACYKSMRSGRWEPVELDVWRGKEFQFVSREFPDGADGADAELGIIKTERLPDGRTKTILKDKATGRVIERIG
jgi:hypothetical protein